MSQPEENYYTLLQLDPAAEPEVIESAYRRLARKYHPDLNSSSESSARMRGINEAYAALINPTRRAIYDRELKRVARQQRSSGGPPRSAPARTGDRSVGGPPLRDYRAAVEPLKAAAAASMRGWAVDWSDSLDALVAGDGRGRQRSIDAGQRCLTELTDCLAQWEALAPPAAARRLSDLGAACLKLQIALLRGMISFGEGGDPSLLGPLAGLAERVSGLTRTVASEELALHS